MSASSLDGTHQGEGAEGWRPRRHDHLVEPFFAGLEVEGEESGEPTLETSTGGWWQWLVERLRGA